MTALVYALAALAELAGGFAFWAWLRLGRSAWWLAPGVAALLLFAWLLTLVDTENAGRAYAAYGASISLRRSSGSGPWKARGRTAGPSWGRPCAWAGRRSYCVGRGGDARAAPRPKQHPQPCIWKMILRATRTHC